MTQSEQPGFLKKKNSILIIASFSLVLGCGLHKPSSNDAPESEVKIEKSIEDEVKERSSTDEEKKNQIKVTQDQLISFVE